MKRWLIPVSIGILISSGGIGEELIVGKPVPADWKTGLLVLNQLEFMRQQEPGLNLEGIDNILRASLEEHLGQDPASWPDAVKQARQHDLKKHASQQRLQWLRDDDPGEAALLEQDLADPFHYWLRVLKRESQPLSPMRLRLNYIDLYFDEVFPYLCKWLNNDMDGSILQPEIVNIQPPQPPPILMSITPDMPKEEMLRIVQSPAFIEASQAYQKEALAYQQAIGSAGSSTQIDSGAVLENWLGFNGEIHDRFLAHLEAKSFTIAAILLDAYSTQVPSSASGEESASMYQQAVMVKEAMARQLSGAVAGEADAFQRLFLSNLDSRFGNYTWQAGTATHSLTYRPDLETVEPDPDDLTDIDEHLIGRNRFGREGFVAKETVTDPGKNWERDTLQISIESSISQLVDLDKAAPTTLIDKKPDFLITASEDPYDESAITLNLIIRGIPHDLGHMLNVFLAAGGKGADIDETTVKKQLKQAFKEAFIATAGSLYSALPPWPDPPGTERVETIALIASAEPREVLPDGESIVTIRFKSLRYPAERGAEPVPFPNVELVIELNPVDGKVMGELSSSTITTDAAGQATVEYRVPSSNKLVDTGIRSVSIHASSPDHGIQDTAYVNFASGASTVLVEPNFGGVVSGHGIVPADPRYPARILARIEDADVQLKAGAPVTFRIISEKPMGRLYDSAGTSGSEITATSGKDGFAEVIYRCNDDVDPATILTETVLVESPGVLESQRATILVGMDLSVTHVRNLYEGKGMVNAGEEIPVSISVKNAAREKASDLLPYISYWGSGGSAGDESVSVQLTIEPVGAYPKYLLTQVAAEAFPAPVFSDHMDLRRSDDLPGNTLWMRSESRYNYSGLPRVETRYEGHNYFVVTVTLVDSSGNPLPDANPSNNMGYLSIPAGLPADAFAIYFLENPLGPNTPEAVFFRSVLNLMGFGTMLSITDAVQAVSTGDMQALANIVLSEFTGNLAGAISESGSALAEYADLFSQMTFAEQLTTTFIETKAPIADLQSDFIKAAMQSSKKTGTKLLVVTGDGSQQIIDARSGKPVTTTDQSIQFLPDDAVFSLQRGPVTILSVPASFQYTTVNASSVQEFAR